MNSSSYTYIFTNIYNTILYSIPMAVPIQHLSLQQVKPVKATLITLRTSKDVYSWKELFGRTFVIRLGAVS